MLAVWPQVLLPFSLGPGYALLRFMPYSPHAEMMLLGIWERLSGYTADCMCLAFTLCPEQPMKELCPAALGRMKALMRREFLLMKRNLVVYKAKVLQVVCMALVTATLFLRTHIHPISPYDGQEVAGFLFVATLTMLFNGLLAAVQANEYMSACVMTAKDAAVLCHCSTPPCPVCGNFPAACPCTPTTHPCKHCCQVGHMSIANNTTHTRIRS